MNKKNLSRGVLLVNLGTPDFPTKKDVRRYLAEFLWDKRILKIYWLLRFFLLYFIILPLRSGRSAKLYQNIWTAEGSPLLVWTQKSKNKLQEALGENYCVEIGMRYGNPSIVSGIEKLLRQNVSHITIVPLFPQYAAGTTGSVIEVASKHLASKWYIPTFEFAAPFFRNSYFIKAFTKRVQETLQTTQPDFILFSYHGLPEAHLKQTAQECIGKSECFSQNCCTPYELKNHFCYRAQCVETTRLIADSLGLQKNQYETSFQSRFGKSKWIEPDTQKVLVKLYEKGARVLAIVCPGFVADCLETLEEIEIRLNEDWLALGGKKLILVKSLNAEPLWIECLTNLVRTD